MPPTHLVPPPTRPSLPRSHTRTPPPAPALPRLTSMRVVGAQPAAGRRRVNCRRGPGRRWRRVSKCTGAVHGSCTPGGHSPQSAAMIYSDLLCALRRPCRSAPSAARVRPSGRCPLPAPHEHSRPPPARRPPAAPAPCCRPPVFLAAIGTCCLRIDLQVTRCGAAAAFRSVAF
jgi:hypothetical protein